MSENEEMLTNVTTEDVEALESTTNEEPKSMVDDVFDEETLKNLDIFKHQAELADLQKMMDAMSAKKNDALKGNDNIDDVATYIDTVIDTYSIEDIKNLSDDEINAIFIRDAEENGGEISIDTGDLSDEAKMEFKRDFLIYRKETADAEKSIQDSIVELNSYLDQYNEEMNALNEEFGTMEKYVIDSLDKKIADNTESPERIALYTKIRNAYKEAFTLEGLINYVESYKGKDIVLNFVNYDKTMKIYSRYLKVNKKLNIARDLTTYAGFERLLYDEEQLKTVRVNIFVFAVISYIASKPYDQIDNTFGIFISQLATNIKNVIYDNNMKSDERLEFIDNVKRVIEIIG